MPYLFCNATGLLDIIAGYSSDMFSVISKIVLEIITVFVLVVNAIVPLKISHLSDPAL